jgi:hypothetical protein
MQLFYDDVGTGRSSPGALIEKLGDVASKSSCQRSNSGSRIPSMEAHGDDYASSGLT